MEKSYWSSINRVNSLQYLYIIAASFIDEIQEENFIPKEVCIYTIKGNSLPVYMNFLGIIISIFNIKFLGHKHNYSTIMYKHHVELQFYCGYKLLNKDIFLYKKY